MAAPPSTVQASGEATVQAKPDMAELDLGVVSRAKTAQAAGAENARKMERVMATLRKELGPGGEVKTVGYLVGPQYGQPTPSHGNPPIVGYTVTNLVRVVVPDVNAVGRIIDSALGAGANEVQRLVFTLKNPEAVQAEALRLAATRARARAATLAGALGVRITGVVSVTEGEAGQLPRPMAERDVAAFKAAADTPVEVGTLDVRATVTAVFAVSQR